MEHLYWDVSLWDEISRIFNEILCLLRALIVVRSTAGWKKVIMSNEKKTEEDVYGHVQLVTV